MSQNEELIDIEAKIMAGILAAPTTPDALKFLNDLADYVSDRIRYINVNRGVPQNA